MSSPGNGKKKYFLSVATAVWNFNSSLTFGELLGENYRGYNLSTRYNFYQAFSQNIEETR